jgi:hypothetical protein
MPNLPLGVNIGAPVTDASFLSADLVNIIL